MDLVSKIFDKADSLFNIAGISRLPGGDSLLILGLESTPERNLDDFGHKDGNFLMYGFEKHIKPRLESLLDFIHEVGYDAEPVGRYGYPLKGEINLKELAIRAGLGKRGKNTVVLHPRYGPRLRFIAVRTNAPIESHESPALADEENPVCNQCSICIDACPVNALEPYRMPDTSICLSNITPITEDGHSVLCDICLYLCPAAKR